LTTTEANY